MAQSSKSFIKKMFGSKFFLFAAMLALIGLALNVGRESYRKYQLSKEIKKLEANIKRLEGRNGQLNDLMNYFSEESFLEKEARVKLNLQKPGEKVVIFSNPNGRNNSGQPNQPDNGQLGVQNNHNQETDDLAANCWKWWEYFFKRD